MIKKKLSYSDGPWSQRERPLQPEHHDQSIETLSKCNPGHPFRVKDEAGTRTPRSRQDRGPALWSFHSLWGLLHVTVTLSMTHARFTPQEREIWNAYGGDVVAPAVIPVLESWGQAAYNYGISARKAAAWKDCLLGLFASLFTTMINDSEIYKPLIQTSERSSPEIALCL